MARERNFGLDVVRATAIILVLVSHGVLLLYPNANTIIATILKLGGALGVDIFFVLSGFLIGGLLLDLFQPKKSNFKRIGHFWIRRWFRTLPNYFLILCINCALGFYVFQSLPPDLSSYFYFFQNFSDSQSDFFTESWTLSIEEFSYLFAPLAIFFVSKTIKNQNHAFLLGTLILIALATYFRINYHLNHTNIDYAYWSSNVRKVVIYRLDAIFYGFLAVYLHCNFKNFIQKKATLFFLVGSAIIIFLHLSIFFLELTPNNAPGLYNIIYLPLLGLGLSLLLWFSFTLKTDTNWVFKTITYISKRSYALYLINYSIVLLSLNFLQDKDLISSRLLIFVLYVLFTFGLSELLYRYYEKPMMHLREHPIFKSRKQ